MPKTAGRAEKKAPGKKKSARHELKLAPKPKPSKKAGTAAPEPQSAPAIFKGREITEDERQALRRRCQTDLFFLAHDVLGYDQLTAFTHQQLCDFFVKKNPDLGIFEQDEMKRRLLLFPRYGFKSTVNIADCVQWIICFPNIRILVLTGEKDLAKAFVDEMQGHFIATAEGEPTDFQALFPEFCIREKDKLTGKFTAPCRTKGWKEPTIFSSSIESTLPGWHFDIFKGDDIVTNMNSDGETAIRKVNRNFRLARKTLHPRGFLDLIGTRYGPFEIYGETIKKAKPGKLKVLCKPAWSVKPESAVKPEEELGEADYDLLFPELLTYQFLCDERDDDPEGFQCQYLNNPMGGQELTFPKETLLQATVASKSIPAHGEMFIAWRFAYPGKNNMRHTAGVVGLMDGLKMYIVDAVHGKFIPSKLAYRCVDLARKWGVHAVSIEETPGARYMEDSIRNYARQMNWQMTVNWIPFQEDDGARELRIKNAEPLLVSMRLLFADNIGCLAELYEQFVNFMLMQDGSLPDAIAHVSQWLPRSIAVAPAEEQAELWKEIQRRDLYEKIHGLGEYQDPEPDEPTPREPEENYFYLSEIMPGLNG